MLPRMAQYLTTRNQIICILFFTYIYDLVRAGFIESRRRQLEILKSVMDRTGDKSRQMPISNPARNFYSGNAGWIGGPRFSGHHRVTYLRDSNLSNPSDMQVSYRPAFIQRLRLASVNETTQGLSEELGLYPIQRLPQQAAHRGRAFAVSLSPPILHQSASTHMNLKRPSEPTIYEQTTPTKTATCDDDPQVREPETNDNANNFDDLKADDECPLGEMPKLIRHYQYFSTLLVIYSFIKYSFLVIFDNELFGSKKTFACYVPGRVAILPEFSPGFSWVVLFYHIIYRFYLLLIRKEFHLECFIFLLYDKQAVEAIQTEKCAKLQCNDPVEASRIYAMNRLFFIKVYLREEPEQVIYRIKSNRSVEHWIKLKQFFNRFVLIALGNIALWSIPLGVAIVVTVLSSENFSTLYDACDEMITLHKTDWSLHDPRQLLWFLCDMVDSSWLLLDTTMALVMPFTSMVFCSQDLNITIDKLREVINDITNRLKCALEVANYRNWPQQIELNRNRRVAKMLKAIEVEILVLQSEVTRMLQQINQVDEFMSKLSAFCIMVWILTNIYVQIVSLNRNQLVFVDVVVQFMQGTALLALTFTFAYIARVNTKTRRLYMEICNLVALDPNHKTKSSWLWVLEYFNKVKPNYSFRLGPFTELTLANYLKACSWLITGALVTINLFKYKYNIHD